MRFYRTSLCVAAVAASLAPAIFAQVSDKQPTSPKSPVAVEKGALALQAADPKTTAEVRDTLTQLINAATTEGQFQTVVAHLAQQDRQHIGEMAGEKFAELNQAIAHFRADFQSRYHQEFHLSAEHLKEATVSGGQVKDAVIVSLSDLEKNPAVSPSPAGALPSPLKPAGEAPRISNDVPANTGLSVVPGPMVSLTREGRSGDTNLWKVNIANEISGRQIKENLTRHLQKLDDQKATWSDDPNATARAVASQVLQSLNDSTLASEQ